MAIRQWKSGAYGGWSDRTKWVADAPPPGVGEIAAFIVTEGGNSFVTGDATVGQIVVLGKGAGWVTFAGNLNLIGSVPNAHGVTVTVPGLRIDEWRVVELAGHVTTAALIDIGHTYGGTLNIFGGILSSRGTIILGEGATGHGLLQMNGGTLSAYTVVIGDYGVGKMSINAHASVYTEYNTLLGVHAGSHGELDIGAGQRVDGESMVVGGQGSGLLTIGHDASLFTDYEVGGHGEIRLAGGALSSQSSGTVDVGGMIDGSGLVTSGPEAESLVNNGIVRAVGDLTVAAYVYIGGPVTGTGVFQIASDSTLFLRDNIRGPQIQFLDSNGTLDATGIYVSLDAAPYLQNTQLGGSPFFGIPATPILGFQIGDTIKLSDTIDRVSFNPATSMLAVMDRGSVIDTLYFKGSSFAGDTFNLGHEGDRAIITLSAGVIYQPHP